MLEIPSKEYTSEELDRLEAISHFHKHPASQKLIELVELRREQYFANLARGLATQQGPVDQREIDEKRGFWKGALWALKTLPKLTDKEWQKFVAEALSEDEKESDAA